jgi:hypothetical protein
MGSSSSKRKGNKTLPNEKLPQTIVEVKTEVNIKQTAAVAGTNNNMALTAGKRTCSACYQAGHNVKTCPNKSHCSNCRNAGHNTRTCPKKATKAAKSTTESTTEVQITQTVTDTFQRMKIKK